MTTDAARSAEPPCLVDLAPGDDGPPAVAESHISVVVFAGSRAYKLLKPVDFGFIDLTTRERRRQALLDELTINRRFAPDVYLDVLDLADGEGRLHDHMLVMRRLPHSRRLSHLLDEPEAPGQLRRVARAVAAIHASAPRTAAAATAAGWDTVCRNWRDNFDTMAPFVGTLFDREDFDRVRRLVTAYLDGRRPLFAARIEQGHAIDGHGDLLAEDIFCLDDGPRILDCLAFDETLRCGDVLADAAFLAMDIERLAGPARSESFMSWYREFSNEHHPGSLAHFYVAYRAHVRAKVSALKAAQGDHAAAAAAPSLHDLAQRHAERALPRLVLLGGGPGSGKTTLAENLAAECGWAVLGSDELRKDLVGIGHDVHVDHGLDRGIYRPDITAEMYDELVRRAGHLLSMGESVILDASWTNAHHRDLARAEAHRHHSAVVELCCRTDLPQALGRVRRRMQLGGDASDATPDVVAQMSARMAPWPEAVVVDTSRTVEESLSAALDHVTEVDPLTALRR
jgi:aminoglycoside phosphotransferase family enzyme/predicted kinase